MKNFPITINDMYTIHNSVEALQFLKLSCYDCPYEYHPHKCTPKIQSECMNYRKLIMQVIDNDID